MTSLWWPYVTWGQEPDQAVHSDQPQPEVDLLWVVTIIVVDLEMKIIISLIKDYKSFRPFWTQWTNEQRLWPLELLMEPIMIMTTHMSFCLAFLTPPKKSVWPVLMRVMIMMRMMVGVMFLIVTFCHVTLCLCHASRVTLCDVCNAPPPLNVMVSI